MFKGPQIPPLVFHEIGGPYSYVETWKEIKEIRTVEVPIYLTYQRGTSRLFAAARQVFAPRNVEGTLHSSSAHRQILAPQDAEGALPSSSTQQVHVQ